MTLIIQKTGLVVDVLSPPQPACVSISSSCCPVMHMLKLLCSHRAAVLQFPPHWAVLPYSLKATLSSFFNAKQVITLKRLVGHLNTLCN